jgi:1-hydroxycarotenoid 3,4-desaturase
MTTVVIGGGIGGLAAAISLAARGEAVTVIERQSAVGGKLRPLTIEGETLDGCATVMTMRWVFEELFALAHADLGTFLPMQRLKVYGRHYWTGGSHLDLLADKNGVKDEFAHLAGRAAALQYAAFMSEAEAIYEDLKEPFLKCQRPSPLRLAASMSLSRLLRIRPFETLSAALKRHFTDRRLAQLFGRYATYCGSSPFRAPATLMLIAAVEAEGVWRISGGMSRLPLVLKQLAESLGVEFLLNKEVAEIGSAHGRIVGVRDREGNWHSSEHVILNADPTALASGIFGDLPPHDVKLVLPGDRSLSAVTWVGSMLSRGVPLEHHTVFFSDDYATEFLQLERKLPDDPTVYICDQGQGRKQMLINAPAEPTLNASAAEAVVQKRLQSCGFQIDLGSPSIVRRTPREFSQLYPGTQGALYGRALNSWNATFLRPQARTRIPGLYLAGGAVHPGPGVPMAALSGMRAAEALLQDRASMRPFRKTATAGGTSTH